MTRIEELHFRAGLGRLNASAPEGRKFFSRTASSGGRGVLKSSCNWDRDEISPWKEGFFF